MNKEDLSAIISLIDAAMNKGGIIAPDAMFIFCNLRQKAISLRSENEATEAKEENKK